MKTSIVLIAILSIPAFAFSTTIYVPDDYPSIQQAIDAAMDGDTIIVRQGTYVENIDFKGKAITVKSEQGADVTAIDGHQAGSVVTFTNGEGIDSVIEGFTLCNGTGTYYKNPAGGWGNHGGGIFCLFSSPTIKNNIITNNSAEGGGIYCSGFSSPIIDGNTIIGNPGEYHGGGIACENSSNAEIRNNSISENSACYGGGIFCGTYSSGVIENNTIAINSVDNIGGGICCDFFSSPT
ncbi:MAG: right-handed parallel beta-helix repeat-containing protein, partial [Planctomycetota bacterium]